MQVIEEGGRGGGAAKGRTAGGIGDGVGVGGQREAENRRLVERVKKGQAVSGNSSARSGLFDSQDFAGVAPAPSAERAPPTVRPAPPAPPGDPGMAEEPAEEGEADFAFTGEMEKSMNKAKDARRDKMAWDEKKNLGAGYLNARSRERAKVRQFYRKLPPTEEWAENNYYKLPIERQNADLIHVNAFWNDYAAHPEGTPFLSGNFIHDTRNLSEMMLALAVIDLPLEPAENEVKTKGQ